MEQFFYIVLGTTDQSLGVNYKIISELQASILAQEIGQCPKKKSSNALRKLLRNGHSCPV